MPPCTPGDGDPPDNGAKFYAAIRRKSHAGDALAGLPYTVRAARAGF